jgi:hypothetical protein
MSMTVVHPQSVHSLSLATCEPYFSYVHGENDNGKLIVIYEYTLDEFYDNDWKDELSFYKKKMLNKVKYQHHPMIRNYKNILKKSKLELVEIIEENNVSYSILHTYKLNILKRLWKKYKNQFMN